MSERDSSLDELLAALVERSETGNADENEIPRQFQELLHSGDEDPFLDSALAMLGFTRSAVQENLSTISGKSLLTVLSSSIASASKLYFECLENAPLSTNAPASSCFIGTSGSPETMAADDAHIFFGTPFFLSRTRKVLEGCLCFLEGSQIEDRLVLDILEALVKVYSMTSMCKSRLVGSCLLYKIEDEQEEALASEAFQHLIKLFSEKKGIIYNHFSPTVRLLLWRLQPGLLAQDLSALLETISERPLMSLQNEFRCRQSWGNLIIAMASGPDVFKEARRILNDWLLLSGATFVWEMKVELGILIRDVLEFPSLWNLSVEEGIRLPSLSAFYGGALHGLVMMLNQSPSWAGLREISIFLENEVAKDEALAASNFDGFMRDSDSVHEDTACSSSLWMLLMDFPMWMIFACFTLFQKLSCPCQKSDDHCAFLSEQTEDQSEPNSQGHAAWLHHQETAARYIAWHFSPHDKKLRGVVVQMLRQIAQSWLQMNDESSTSGSAVKRRKLTTSSAKGIDLACGQQKLVEEMFAPDTLPRDARMETTSHDSNFSYAAVVAVHKWLLSFQECCGFLDDYVPGEMHQVAAIDVKQQAKKRLELSDVSGRGATAYGSECSEAMCTHHRSFTFFCSLPLVALLCSPFMHIDMVVHLFLHFIMVGSRHLLSTRDIYEAEMKGLSCKEPSHRTEGFRDVCQEPFCLSFSRDVSAFKASGVSRVFKFLETLELLEVSSLMESSDGSLSLDSFKEAVARQLQLCLRSWSQHGDSHPSLIMLDDLQMRASLWAARAGLESKTFNAFKQALQGLDILIATSFVDDTV